jgi:hypothetical protein
VLQSHLLAETAWKIVTVKWNEALGDPEDKVGGELSLMRKGWGGHEQSADWECQYFPGVPLPAKKLLQYSVSHAASQEGALHTIGTQ